MFLHITPLYAAALGLIYVALSGYVIAGRFKHELLLGTGGNADMEKRVRIHGNFAEYVPFGLLLLAMAEFRGATDTWLHLLCVLLVVGRFSHAYAIHRGKPAFLFRVFGMITTFASFTGAAVLILIG